MTVVIWQSLFTEVEVRCSWRQLLLSTSDWDLITWPSISSLIRQLSLHTIIEKENIRTCIEYSTAGLGHSWDMSWLVRCPNSFLNRSTLFQGVLIWEVSQVPHSLISCCSDLSLSSVLPSSVMAALLSSVIMSLEENSITSYPPPSTHIPCIF